MVWLHRSTSVRRSFRIFSRSSGQSFAWPTCTNKSRKSATWVLISIISCNDDENKRRGRELYRQGMFHVQIVEIEQHNAHFEWIRLLLLLMGHISGRPAAGSSSPTNYRTAPPAWSSLCRDWKHGFRWLFAARFRCCCCGFAPTLRLFCLACLQSEGRARGLFMMMMVISLIASCSESIQWE